MKRYYTRACNFYHGNESKKLVAKKKSLPLNGNKEISFDCIEIISRQSKKKVSINLTGFFAVLSELFFEKEILYAK